MNTLFRRGFLVALFVVAFAPFSVGAFQINTGEQPLLSADKTVADDLYMAGGSVTAAGTVQGDLVVTGGSVLVSGAVSEDIIAAGGSIILLGNVGDDVRAAGGTIVVQSTVNGDVVVGGGQITLSGSRIGGDVVVGGGLVTITAPVSGDIRIAGGEVMINAPVSGNVKIDADKITLGENAVISGDFTYSSKEEAIIVDGARVEGETVFTAFEGSHGANRSDIIATIAALVTLLFIAKFLMLLVGALLLGLFFRRYANELVSRSLAQPWAELGRGLVFIIVLPVVSVVLMATIIGFPLGALGLLAFVGVSIVASFAGAILTGSALHKWISKSETPVVSWKTILLGAVVFEALNFIPFIGWLVKAGIILIAIGVMWSIKWSVAKEWR